MFNSRLQYPLCGSMNACQKSLWSEETRNFCSDVKIKVRQAVNMILLLVSTLKINQIFSVARGQSCSDVSVIIDCKLTSCTSMFSSHQCWLQQLKKSGKKTRELLPSNLLFCSLLDVFVKFMQSNCT